MNRWWRDYLGIILGVALTATSLNMFLIPNKIAAGGVSGLATVLHHLFNWPVGVTMLAVNIPLFLYGVKLLGARYGVNTLFGAVMLSLCIDVLAPFTPVLTHDPLLNALYGGVLAGIGMGLVFRYRGNTAGTALVASILHKLFGISIGQAMLAADFFVVAFAGIAFQSAELSLYAIISIYVTAQIVDLIQEGPSSGKAFIIMTDKSDTVSAAIMTELDRGVTYFQGKGCYTGDPRDMLLCVVAVNEVIQLKELIRRLDSQAFVIVSDVHEVLGEGFKEVSGK